MQHLRRNSQNGLRRPSIFMAQRKFIMDFFSSNHGSTRSLNTNPGELREKHKSKVKKMKNRRMGK